MKKVFLGLLIIGASLIWGRDLKQIAAPPPDALGIAHELDKTVFRGWSYGPYDPVKKHLDCVSFVSAVMDTILSRHGILYTPEMRQDVMIDHPNFAQDVVRKGPDPQDPRYGGVSYAIVKYGLGEQIRDMSDVRPGDFIQYWKQHADGSWFGHASLIESVGYDVKRKAYKARIFGSHQSSGGIAVSSFELFLSGPDRVVYIGRIR